MDDPKEKGRRFETLVKDGGRYIKSRIGSMLFDVSPEKHAIKLLYGLVAFILARGQWFFGAYPFGIALLCSAKEHLWFIWGGCVIASFFTEGISPFAMIAVYTLILTVRSRTVRYFKEKDKRRFSYGSEPLGVKIALASALSFVPGLYVCISEGFSLHALFSLLFYLITTGVLTLLYSGAFYGMEALRIHKKAALLALSFSVVCSFTNVSVFGFSPTVTVAAFLCLLASSSEDFLFCAALGLAVGIPCGREYAAVFIITGAVASAFGKYSRRLSPMLGVLSGFAFSLYNRGASAFIYVLPDLVSGYLLYLPASMLIKKVKSAHGEKDAVQSEQKEAQAEAPRVHFERLSGKIGELSAQLRTPTEESAERILNESIDEICSSCRFACFSNEKSRQDLTSHLLKRGSLLPDRFEQAHLPLCSKRKMLCERVNGAYADYLRRLTLTDRAACLSDQFRTVSNVLSDREAQDRQEKEKNEQESLRFSQILDHLALNCKSAEVIGCRNCTYKAIGVDTAMLREKNVDEIREVFETRIGRKMSTPLLINENGTGSLVFHTLPRLQARTGSFQKQKENEAVNGDSLFTFHHRGYFYAMICDGMGSGREASLISQIACRFIAELTMAGAEADTMLRALNDFLLCQSCECSSTVDLMRLDLYNGRCDFIKCGACASLVLRGDNTFKIASASIPAGASKEVNYESVTVKLRAGDRVILVSDGVSGEIEGSAWLQRLLDGSLRSDAQGLAEDILTVSEKQTKNDDDKTVLVVDVVA